MKAVFKVHDIREIEKGAEYYIYITVEDINDFFFNRFCYIIRRRFMEKGRFSIDDDVKNTIHLILTVYDSTNYKDYFTNFIKYINEVLSQLEETYNFIEKEREKLEKKKKELENFLNKTYEENKIPTRN
jgi:cell shape-determining protein MreC